MTITTQRIRGGKQYRVIARQGNFSCVAIAKNKRTAFNRAVTGAWRIIH